MNTVSGDACQHVYVLDMKSRYGEIEKSVNDLFCERATVHAVV